MDDWRENAACNKAVMPELWFSSDEIDIAIAKRVCKDCVVRRACLDYAITNREVYGIWGGEDLGGRERERKARRRAELERKQRVA